MDDAQFEAFLSQAVEELRTRQRELSEVHGLGGFARWWFDQAVGRLEFFDASGALVLTAEQVCIGSFAPSTGTWLWAWSNESLEPALRERARVLQEIAAETGLGIFRRAGAIELDGEAMAWELAAVAVRKLGALGCYRAPHGAEGPWMFHAILRIDKHPGTS